MVPIINKSFCTANVGILFSRHFLVHNSGGGGGGGGGILVRVTERENVNVARNGAMVGGQWCYLCVVCVAQVYAFAVLLNACILTRGNPPTPPYNTLC